MEIETQTFQIILVIIGIASTVVIAYLFKFVIRPTVEKVFDENQRITKTRVSTIIIEDYRIMKHVYGILDRLIDEQGLNEKIVDMNNSQTGIYVEINTNDKEQLKGMLAGYVRFVENFDRDLIKLYISPTLDTAFENLIGNTKEFIIRLIEDNQFVFIPLLWRVTSMRGIIEDYKINYLPTNSVVNEWKKVFKNYNWSHKNRR